MMGEFQGVVTRLENDTPYNVYQVWCGLHQLDLMMKHGFKGLMEGKVINILAKFVRQCQEQVQMQALMDCVCPNLMT